MEACILFPDELKLTACVAPGYAFSICAATPCTACIYCRAMVDRFVCCAPSPRGEDHASFGRRLVEQGLGRRVRFAAGHIQRCPTTVNRPPYLEYVRAVVPT